MCWLALYDTYFLFPSLYEVFEFRDLDLYEPPQNSYVVPSSYGMKVFFLLLWSIHTCVPFQWWRWSNLTLIFTKEIVYYIKLPVHNLRTQVSFFPSEYMKIGNQRNFDLNIFNSEWKNTEEVWVLYIRSGIMWMAFIHAVSEHYQYQWNPRLFALAWGNSDENNNSTRSLPDPVYSQ